MSPIEKIGCRICPQSSSRSRRINKRKLIIPFQFHPSFSTSTGTSTTNNDNINNNNNDNIEYLTNGGIVEGVWIFCRHGDRAPSRPLCPPHKLEEESKFWLSRLPKPNSYEAYLKLSKNFPPKFHSMEPLNDGQFLDVRRPPFGFLTHTGLQQTKENGIRLFKRYNNHGYHLPTKSNYTCGQDFLDVWDMKVYSTNYLRTIMSVQSFLDGLLGTKCYESLLEEHMFNHRPSNHNLDQIQIPNHNTIIDDDDDREENNNSNINKKEEAQQPLVNVEIRGRDDDTLNAFDRNPDLMANLVGDVISSSEFQERDSQASQLAARLANILPGLARTNTAKGFNAAPSGINWIEATDHFVCRQAHGMEYSKFSDYEHDSKVEMTLDALSHQTRMHLAWRFRQWYKNPRLLAAIAAPPLREITSQLQDALALTKQEQRLQKHPFTVYSCHDVTILALLYGIGAEFLSGDDMWGGWRYWPEYASTLVFELVRINDDDDDDEQSPSSDTSHVVRVLLNGRPVHSVDQQCQFWDDGGSIQTMGSGPCHMLYANEFEEVVSKLEHAGGNIDRIHQLQSDDPSIERDMSNWTG